jgi:hypothetical protein
MEAERPMQNDERDNRDLPPDEPSQQPPADEADEFETAPWPAQDTPPAAGEPAAADAAGERGDAGEPPAQDRWTDEASRREEPPPRAEEPLPESEPSVAGQVEARAQMADEPAVDETQSSPPPPEVEAYAAPVPAPAASSAVPAHSVPATEPGESTQCPRCGTENRPGIAFCRNCGQRLVAAGAPTTVARPAAPEGTQACPRCGTHNRAGVAFCQNCGANLAAAAPEAPGYVPPAADADAAAAAKEAPSRHAVLGPIVLLVGAVGIATGWLLPFAIGSVSLFDRAFGDASGYGVAFWTAYNDISGLAAQAYFGFAAPAPILIALLVALAVGGAVRAPAGRLQLVGLVIALLWAIGLLVLFVVVEVFGGSGDDVLRILAALSPAGIIFALASLIVMIGVLTRFGRG